MKKPQKNSNLPLNIFSSFKAKRRARKIMKALREAEQIHKGNKKGKSFDDFLEEL